jgi:hypothetical protein
MPARNSTFRSSLSTQPSARSTGKSQPSRGASSRREERRDEEDEAAEEEARQAAADAAAYAAAAGAAGSAARASAAGESADSSTATESSPQIVSPTPPPPATDYINVSTTVSSNVVQVGLNPQRPELLGVFDFPACFKNGQPTPAAQLLDVQFQFKQAGYTSVASMLEPYTEGLKAFKKSFDQIQSENTAILTEYESMMPGFQAMLDALNFSTGNSRRNFSYLDGVTPSVSLYADVYNTINNKSLQNFLLDICKLDNRFIMGLSNTAAYMQCCLEYKNLIKYGLIPAQYREFSTTDGFTTVGSSYPAEYLQIVDALYTVSSTVSMTSSDVSTAKNKMSNVLSAEISQLHSIVYRNSCADRLLLASSPYDRVDSMVAGLIIDYDAGDVLGQSGTRSIISSRAYARTVNGGNVYQPLETNYVTAQNADVETGRKILIDSFLNLAVLAGGIDSSDISAYEAYVSEVLTPADSMSVSPAVFPLSIFVEQDATNLPRSIQSMYYCIKEFGALITGCGLTGESATYQDLFVLNLLSLAVNDSDLLFRLSRFLAAKEHVDGSFLSATYTTEALASIADATVAKSQALESLATYVKGMVERKRAMSVRSTSSSAVQLDFDAGSAYGTAINLDGFISSALDRDDGPLSYIARALKDYNSTLNYRFSTTPAYSYTESMDYINVDSILCVFTYTFSYLVRTSLSIGIVGLRSGGSVKSFYENQGGTFNVYRYSKNEAELTKNACAALLQYKDNQSLTTNLAELITEPRGFLYAREFANVVQGQIDKLLTEEASMVYLATTFIGFAVGVREAKSKISDLITSLTSNDPLEISDSFAASVKRIPVPTRDLDYFVSGFSVDQLLTSIAMNKTSSRVSLDHPAFPVCKTLDANEMHNLKTYLTNLERRLSSNADRNRIVAVGIPAGMLTFLRDQTGRSTSFASADEISSNDGPFKITVRLMARNQRKDSDPVVVADFLFDTRIFALGGTDANDYTVKDFNNLSDLYKGTPFYKVSGTTRIEKIEPSVSSIEYLINHFNDNYCKLFLKAMIGLDLSEQNFTLEKTVTKNSPDALKADTFSKMIDILSTRFPDIITNPSFRDAIGRTIFFNENLYRSRPIYTKIFDRIFCIPINLDSLGFMLNDDVDMKDLYCVIYMDSSAPASLTPPLEITASFPAVSPDALSGEIMDDAVSGFGDTSTGRLGNITSGGDTGTAQFGDVNIRSGIEAGVDVLSQVQVYVENGILNSMIQDVSQGIIIETLDRGESMAVNPLISVESLNIFKNEIEIVDPIAVDISRYANNNYANRYATSYLSRQSKAPSVTTPAKQSSINPDIVATKNVDAVSQSVQAIKNIEQISTNITGTPMTDSVKSSVAAGVSKVATVNVSNYKNAVTSNVQATKEEIATLSLSATKSVEVSQQITTQNNLTANKNVASNAAATSVRSNQSSANISASAAVTQNRVGSTTTRLSTTVNSVAAGASAASAASSAASRADAVASAATSNITAAAKTYTNRRK